MIMNEPGCVSNLLPSKGDREGTSPECTPLTCSIMLFSAFSMLSDTEEMFGGWWRYSSAFPNCGVSWPWAPGCLRNSAAEARQTIASTKAAANHCQLSLQPFPCWTNTYLLTLRNWAEEEEEGNFCVWADCCRYKHLNKLYYMLSWLQLCACGREPMKPRMYKVCSSTSTQPKYIPQFFPQTILI